MQRPRKRFGQHFLHDPAIIDRLGRAIDPRAGDRFIEIGPGRGALTRRLLASRLTTLDAVEIDRDLSARLRVELAADPRFTLHEGDAREVDLDALAARLGGPLRLAGNLPYNLSTPLLFHFLQSRAALIDLHVMLQREVIARIAARPGTAEYGRLTVMLAPWVQVERLFDIGPGAFQPPPKVWSSVARLVVRSQPAFPVTAGFAEVVSAAFSHRRKVLRNALHGLLAAADIEGCGLDPGARPETIAPEGFAALGTARSRVVAAQPPPARRTMG
ncbi:MAG: 16S rRNA (adenine(1518)-N(6)/adenine(1519)-N(6))-dimethyltransferase RsmA [Steroidobacteraceae bacterium]